MNTDLLQSFIAATDKQAWADERTSDMTVEEVNQFIVDLFGIAYDLKHPSDDTQLPNLPDGILCAVLCVANYEVCRNNAFSPHGDAICAANYRDCLAGCGGGVS